MCEGVCVCVCVCVCVWWGGGGMGWGGGGVGPGGGVGGVCVCVCVCVCVVGTCTRRRLYYSESLVRAALSSFGGFHVVGEELTRRVLLIPVYYVPFRRYKDSQALSSVLLASPG